MWPIQLFIQGKLLGGPPSIKLLLHPFATLFTDRFLSDCIRMRGSCYDNDWSVVWILLAVVLVVVVIVEDRSCHQCVATTRSVSTFPCVPPPYRVTVCPATSSTRAQQQWQHDQLDAVHVLLLLGWRSAGPVPNKISAKIIGLWRARPAPRQPAAAEEECYCQCQLRVGPLSQDDYRGRIRGTHTLTHESVYKHT